MGNSIFKYRYCLENNKKWEEVLDFKPNYKKGLYY